MSCRRAEVFEVSGRLRTRSSFFPERAARHRCRLVLLLASLAELAASQTVLAFSVGRSPFEYECWWEKMEFRRLLMSLATRERNRSCSLLLLPV